jgi:hypothetical protein
MLETIFECIKQRINTECPWINDVRIYNQQDIFQEDSLGYKPPTVFVDFQDITYDTIGHKVQQAELTVVIKLVIEDYTKDYLKVLQKKETLNNCLNFWGEWCSDLERFSEQTDTLADALYVFDINYNTTYKTESYTQDKELIGGTSGTSWTIDIDLDIELDINTIL